MIANSSGGKKKTLESMTLYRNLNDLNSCLLKLKKRLRSNRQYFNSQIDLTDNFLTSVCTYVRTRTKITHSWTHYRVFRDHFTTLIPLINVIPRFSAIKARRRKHAHLFVRNFLAGLKMTKRYCRPSRNSVT